MKPSKRTELRRFSSGDSHEPKIIRGVFDASFLAHVGGGGLLRSKQSVLYGLLYGIVVYSLMTFIVFPLSVYDTKMVLPPTAALTRGIVLHILLIGLPISLVVRKRSSKVEQS